VGNGRSYRKSENTNEEGFFFKVVDLVTFVKNILFFVSIDRNAYVFR
jgi:hypothetical protein